MKPVRKTKIPFLILISSLLFFSCSDEKIIEDEQLAKVYVELTVVEDYYADSDSLSLKRSQVFEKYSITEDLYDSAFTKIGYDSERWEEFFTVANEYLDSLKEKVKNEDLKKLP